MNAEEELNKNLYGVHLELLDKHWAFKKCVLEAMEAYAKAYMNEQLEELSDEKIEVMVEKESFQVPYNGSNEFYDQKEAKALRKAAKWAREILKQ